MGLINNICENGLLLEYGMKKAFGKVERDNQWHIWDTKVTYADINKKHKFEVRIKNDKNKWKNMEGT